MAMTAARFFPDLLLGREKPFQLPKSALILPSRYIGDNILMIPFLQQLREALPHSTPLDLVASAPVFSLFEPMPYFRKIWKEEETALKRPADFIAEQGYDTVFFCRYSLPWAIAALGARVPQRVGFDLQRLGVSHFRHWGNALTHAIPSTSLFDEKPQREVYLNILRHLGFQITERSEGLNYQVPPEAETIATRTLQKAPRHPRILLHATAGSPGKKWPMAYWKQLVQILKERYQGTLIALGTEQDRLYYHTLDLESGVPIFNLCGNTTLQESIAILRQVDLVITLDTAMAHLAALAQTPRLVVLYGPTNARQWKPSIHPGTFLEQVSLGLACQPCITRTCAHKSCTRHLSVQQVLEAVERGFKRIKPYPDRHPIPQPSGS